MSSSRRKLSPPSDPEISDRRGERVAAASAPAVQGWYRREVGTITGKRCRCRGGTGAGEVQTGGGEGGTGAGAQGKYRYRGGTCKRWVPAQEGAGSGELATYTTTPRLAPEVAADAPHCCCCYCYCFSSPPPSPTASHLKPQQMRRSAAAAAAAGSQPPVHRSHRLARCQHTRSERPHVGRRRYCVTQCRSLQRGRSAAPAAAAPPRESCRVREGRVGKGGEQK